MKIQTRTPASDPSRARGPLFLTGMRPFVFLAAAALLVVLSIAMGALTPHTEAQDDQTTAIAVCAQPVGAAVQGAHCSQSSLDSIPGTALSHTVLAGACAGADLHVVRYLPGAGTSSRPVVAAYCS